MRIPLAQHHYPLLGADFDPETGELRTHARDSGSPPVAGLFGSDGSWNSYTAAFYRTPSGELELYLGGRRTPIGPATRSEYDPPDPAHLPWRVWGTSRRALRLYEGEKLVLEHRYHGESIWTRIMGVIGLGGPIGAAYDLLYEVHRVLSVPGERERVFRG